MKRGGAIKGEREAAAVSDVLLTHLAKLGDNRYVRTVLYSPSPYGSSISDDRRLCAIDN